MNTQDNAEASRRIIEECFNEGNFDLIEQFCTPNIVSHDSARDDIRGTRAIKESIQGYRDAMSDLKLTVVDIIAEEDKVVLRWRGAGTNDGALMGMPPTNRHSEVTGITIDRFDSAGRITETWTEWDNLGMLTQLGVAEQASAAAQTR